MIEEKALREFQLDENNSPNKLNCSQDYGVYSIFQIYFKIEQQDQTKPYQTDQQHLVNSISHNINLKTEINSKQSVIVCNVDPLNNLTWPDKVQQTEFGQLLKDEDFIDDQDFERLRQPQYPSSLQISEGESIHLSDYFPDQTIIQDQQSNRISDYDIGIVDWDFILELNTIVQKQQVFEDQLSIIESLFAVQKYLSLQIDIPQENVTQQNWLTQYEEQEGYLLKIFPHLS